MGAPQPSLLELLSPRVERRGAALLALLTATHGPIPLSLADARTRTRPAPLPKDDDALRALTERLCIRGGVTELTSQRGAGALTTALRLMGEVLRHAQGHARQRSLALIHGPETGALMASSVATLGVPLSRLIVVRPPDDAFLRVAVRAVKSGAFAAVVVDASGKRALHDMPVAVRRLALAAEETGASVFLLTDSGARRSLPLPTAARAYVSIDDDGAPHVDIVRHRAGHMRALTAPALPRFEARVFSTMTDAPRSARAGRPIQKTRPTAPRGAIARRRRARELASSSSSSTSSMGAEEAG
jgi:hypothetical protein